MAEDKIIVTELEVLESKAVEALAKYQTEIDKTKQVIKELREEKKKEGADIESINKRLAEEDALLREQTRDYKEVRKSVQTAIAARRSEETSVGALIKKYNALNTELKKVGVNSTSPVAQRTRAEMAQLRAEIDKYEGSLRQFFRNVGNYAGAIGKVGLMFGKVALGAKTLYAAGRKLWQLTVDGVNTAMEFNRAQSKLAAILQTTADKLGALTTQARELGATTMYTAMEVTQLQTELAKLGYTSQQIIDMTPGVLRFAQATGAELADSASLTGAALRMYGDSALHTQQYVDAMATATTKSALSFHYLETALPIVGSVANTFNFSLEDTLALLGQLANAGFDASMAATATRNILLNLANTNGDLAKQLGKPVKTLPDLVEGLKKLDHAGINLNETLKLTDKRSVAAFNNFLGKADNILDLRHQLEGVSEEALNLSEQTRNALQQIADGSEEMSQKMGNEHIETVGDLKEALANLDEQGIDYTNTLGLMSEESRTTFQEFLNAADDSDTLQFALNGATGAAERMASTMSDNLYGDTKALESAWQDFMIALNGSQGALRKVVQWITEVVRWMDELIIDIDTVLDRMGEANRKEYSDPNKNRSLRLQLETDTEEINKIKDDLKKNNKGLSEKEALDQAKETLKAQLEADLKSVQTTREGIEKGIKDFVKKGQGHVIDEDRRTWLFNMPEEEFKNRDNGTYKPFLEVVKAVESQRGALKDIQKREAELQARIDNATGLKGDPAEGAGIKTQAEERKAEAERKRKESAARSAKRRSEAEARKAEAEQRKLDANEKSAIQGELKARQAFEKALNKLIGDSIEARTKLVEDEFRQRKEKLEQDNELIQKKIDANDHLTKDAIASLKATIAFNNKQILALEAEQADKIRKIQQEASKEAIELKKQELDAKMKIATLDIEKQEKLEKEALANSNEETMHQLKSQFENEMAGLLELQRQMKMIGIDPESDSGKRINDQKDKLMDMVSNQNWEDLNNNISAYDEYGQKMLDIIKHYQELILSQNEYFTQQNNLITEEANKKRLQREKQVWDNEVAEMQLTFTKSVNARKNYQENEMGLITQQEIDILEKQRQNAAAEVKQIEERGKLQNQTEEEYRAERLAAMQKEADAEAAVNNARLTNQKALVSAMGELTDSLVGFCEQLGEENKSWAKASKVLALAQVAINTGLAISEGIKSSAGVPFPGNLAAIAITLATVMTNITTAISTIKSAKFAQGGKVTGPGTGTSDSISANLSNGEFVSTAKATKLFEPLLMAMNQIAAGTPMQINTSNIKMQREVDMAESFKQAVQEIHPVVSVKDINEGQNRVEVIQALDNF